jgi:3-hydroxyisobutyrate dehydrogenase
MHLFPEVDSYYQETQQLTDPCLLGVAGAQAGTLSFLVGGSEQAFTQAQPILSHMGQRLIYCGSSGAGLGAKICNNV